MNRQIKKILLFSAILFQLIPLFAKPAYRFSFDQREEVLEDFQISRRWAIIENEHSTWELSLPAADFECRNFGDPKFTETEEGFFLSFNWGGGRHLWDEQFYFKDMNGEPCLHRIKSGITSENPKNGEWETESHSREITPVIKLSELNAKKINMLLGMGSLSGE